MDNIVEWRAKLDYSSRPKIKAWGLDVSRDMLEINARVLQPPRGEWVSDAFVEQALG